MRLAAGNRNRLDRRQDRGAYAVEMALVAPIVLALVGFGISVATVLWRSAEVSRIAEIAARAVAVPAVTNVGGRIHRDMDAVISDTGDAFQDGFTVTIERYPEGTAVTDPSTIPEGAAFRVVVSRPFTNPMNALLAPVVGSLDSDGTIVVERMGVRE